VVLNLVRGTEPHKFYTCIIDPFLVGKIKCALFLQI